MKGYLYLSLLPESLVASMLPPEEFGAYLATGTLKQPHGQAMFFRVKPDFAGREFDLSNVDARCVPHPDGRPKHSLYLAIYRVLERVPLGALDSLWLVTAHGRCLELKQAKPPDSFFGKYHLYQEMGPVHPLIASSLDPVQFSRFITDPSKPIFVPRVCFVELALEGMADDPLRGKAANLPYYNIEHIRNCLAELDTKCTKTVDRVAQQAILYRSVKSGSGFFVGDQGQILYYPYPSRDELEGKYNVWWDCANDSELTHAGWGVC
jgi:hypothetical protein